MSARLLIMGLPLVLAACSLESSPPASSSGSPAVSPGGPAVKVVRRAYYPRLESENYWETIPRGETGPEFLLLIRPRIKTPAEGPWTATFRDPEGSALSVHPGLRVDRATSNFTFLCASDRFSPGDWTLELEVEEGGLVSGEPKRVYRFRVQ